ncbi:MAG: rod shape-determining protein MreC [Alphaproteobacteria bacterium]|jgi:rod shape-determining protein MreC|nr:rod shape-determining protein MreC [Alphaproteobacteria bacterium]
MGKHHKQNLHFTIMSLSSSLIKELYMIICVLLSIMLLTLEATKSTSLEKSKMALYDSFSPIFSSANTLTNTIDDFFLNFNTVSSLNKKNKKLLEENAIMQAWRNKALRFEAENKSLQDLLKFSDGFDYDFKSSRIAIDNSRGFHRNVVIESSNFEKNQSVMSSRGLVGRIMETDKDFSNVLLITDVDSKVPAIVERTRDRVIVAGQNSSTLRLDYLPENAEITIGDRIITSGDGSVFLPGLFIGTVSYIDSGRIEVSPATNFNKVEFVSVLIEEKD